MCVQFGGIGVIRAVDIVYGNKYRVAKMEDEVMDERDASQVIRSCSPAERKQVGEEGAGSGDLPKMSCRPGETDKSDYYRKCQEEYAEAIRKSKIPVPISEALMEFFGIKENRMLEREAMVGVWDYILDNGLVATEDNGDEEIGTVYCDEKLKKLFKVDTFHGLDLSLHVIKHLLKRALEMDEDPSPPS
ncbi:hypothetical protein RHGRI_033670 [Rhododendron griersonianum]|uniref:DM2 domain-containing protein n=1 Tax=Rhododendron griersonianum TaxID=479676 RepID=A0AAV6I0V3_9ERIC|nr:hypothetical protein RHGRI_033670 [Rhododendron griersonianum]